MNWLYIRGLLCPGLGFTMSHCQEHTIPIIKSVSAALAPSSETFVEATVSHRPERPDETPYSF